MNLQKFGIKLFLDINGSYSSKDFISVFHNWIQNKVVKDHLLIDVVDYSHILDGPGVMLIAHEGHFSLDQEKNNPGIMYMRKTDLEGEFKERFSSVFKITIDAAKHLKNTSINSDINFINDSFRFITNDRLYAKNTLENQILYKEEIQKSLIQMYPNSKVGYMDMASSRERLAFSVKLEGGVSILE